jgi:hypothetical protein
MANDSFETVDVVITVGKWIGGLLLTFLSFLARVFYKNYTDLSAKVEETSKEMESRLVDVENMQENHLLRNKGKHAELIAKIETLEIEATNRIKRVEELSELKFTEIHKDLETIKESQKETNNLLSRLISKS